MPTTLAGRRDRRFPVRSESGIVEFEHLGFGVIRGSLRQISVSGVSFSIEASDFKPAPETKIENVQITIGDCRLRGGVVVLDVIELDASHVEVGGLFHPASVRDVETLMALISGIDCARRD